MNTDYMTQGRSVTLVGDKNVFAFEIPEILERLHKTISELYDCGYRNFYCGMDVGFGLLAGELTVALKRYYPELILTLAIPFPGQERLYNSEDKFRYRNLIKKADHVITLNESWFSGCLLRRNDFMVDHSSCVVVYYDGAEEGDVYYTCRQAKKKGVRTYNIY